MMFADSSAIVAMLLGERDAVDLQANLSAAERRLVSPAVRLETCMVIASRRDVSPTRAQEFFDELVFECGMIEVQIDEKIGRLAVECSQRYGKGRDRAQLNFGDCLSYACAKAHEVRLLFKGDDFARTDADTQMPGFS